MVTTLDSHGRLVIPSELLKLLGITGKTKLAISNDRNKIVIEPVLDESDFFVEKDGFLVYTGKYDGDFDKLIEEDRNERERRILGL